LYLAAEEKASAQQDRERRKKMGIINNRKRAAVAIILYLTTLFVTNVQAGMPASRKEFMPFVILLSTPNYRPVKGGES
jgi:hypothetical protein